MPGRELILAQVDQVKPGQTRGLNVTFWCSETCSSEEVVSLTCDNQRENTFQPPERSFSLKIQLQRVKNDAACVCFSLRGSAGI